MDLTLEQLTAIERGFARVGGKYTLYILGLMGLVLATFIPNSLPMKIAIFAIVGLSLLSCWLAVRCLRLEKQTKNASSLVPKVAPSPAAISSQAELSPRAFIILCWIYDEDGKVTMERIVDKLKITEPEAKMHLMKLYEKGYISDIDRDHLDAPEGYQIYSDGTEYVLQHREPYQS